MKSLLTLFGAAVLFAVSPVRAAELQNFSVATLLITPNAPLFLAQKQGYFKDEGLDVHVNIFQSAQDVVLAAASGAVEVGNGGLTVGFYNVAAKGGLKIVAATSREKDGFHNNAFLVTKRAYAAGLKTLHDFPGHRVGINAAGSTQHYALGLISQKYGFKMSSVNLVPLQNYPNLIAAFKGGQIDAIVATADIANQLVKEGSGVVIGWSGDETPWQLGAVYTRPSVIASQRPLLEGYLRAFRRASAEFNAAFDQLDSQGKQIKGPKYDELLADLAQIEHQPPSQIALSFPYMDPDARIDVSDIHNQVAFWKEQGLLDPSLNPASVLDLSFMKRPADEPQ